MRLATVLTAALLLIAPLQAESLVSPKPFFRPQDGDTVVFLGDSITHQAFYTQYVENFFYTRYPDRRIRFHNAGVGGDKAGDALARFEDDVAALEPDYVTVLLGMNDGQYEPFSQDTLETYQRGMIEILERIQGVGGDPVVLSPTIFDHHQFSLRQDDETFRFRGRPFHSGYNSLLAYYSSWLRQSASAGGVPFVDLRAPLSEITFSMRRSDPDFTLVEDAIHPGAAGHFIMAAAMIESSIPERPEVSRINITRKNDRWVGGKGEQITGLSGEGDSLSFVFLAKSLPWVVPGIATMKELRWGPSTPAMRGYELVDAGRRLSREYLRVDGLSRGTYELRISEVVIDQFTAAELSMGVDLQSYLHSPQSQQALDVVRMNRTRNDEVIRPMRDLWSKVKAERRKKRERQEEVQVSPALTRQIKRLHGEALAFEDTIYALAQPVAQRYELARIQSP